VDQTPNLTLPYILAAQAQKHITHNEALRKLDAIVQLAVLDRDLASPPASPADGARYIVAGAPTGAWVGHAGHIAAYQDGAWAFCVPNEGWLAWISDEDVLVSWSGSIWTSVSGGGGGGAGGAGNFTTIGVNTTADATNKLAVSAPAVLFNHAGAGVQAKLNKAAAADTASVLYQTAFSGRAELGLTGDDDFHVKVSADGAAWNEAIVVNKTTGKVSLPKNNLWTTFTPVVSAGSGTLGSNPPTATGSYCDQGPIRFHRVLITFPANYSAGAPTASGYIVFTIPNAPLAAVLNGVGRELAVTGATLFCSTGGANGYIYKLSDLSFVAGNSHVLETQFYARMA
jgi:hypothetical protein